ncbi:MAG: O-antigen ligase family protein [Candidatus Uhrbacteria bacterium]
MFEVFLILFALAFAALAWINLRTAAWFVLAALPAYLIRFTIGPVPFTVLEIMILIVLLVWLLRVHNFNKLTKDFAIPAAILVVAATVGIFVAPDTVAALGIWKAYFIEPILFYFVLRSLISNRDHAHHAVIALGTGLFFIALFALIQKFTGLAIPEPWDLTRRVSGVFGYPNALGLYVAPIVVLGFTALGVALRHRFVGLIGFWLVTLSLAIAAVIWSQTEAVWVALPISLLAIATVSKWTRWWAVPASVIGIVLILAIPMIRGPVFEKITLQDYSGGVRLAQWSETIELVKDQPVFGAGLAGYPSAIEPYHQAEHIEIFQYPHNIFLNTWSELGLLGLIALIWIAIEALRLARVGLRREDAPHWLVLGATGALLVMFIHGLVDVPYFKNDLAVLSWSILALLSVSARTK